MSSNIGKKILAILAAVGPGLFLIGYNIGTGSVTTMAKSGAEYGMMLLWALVLSCVFTYVLMVAYGQVTLTSGATALHNIKHHIRFGKPLALYIMAALILGELLALMGIMGLIADLLKEGAHLMTGGPGPDALILILICSVGLYILLWYGRYALFEKVLTVFVILMAGCFLFVFFMVRPSLGSLISGLVPGIPDTPGAFGLVAAMAGTTCSAAVFVMRSTVVAEKGWTIAHLATEKKDSFVSATMMLLLSGVIMAVSAGTLHVAGLKLNDSVELVRLFEPIGGTLAAYILILGITGAGLSTVFPILLIAPWLVCDYMGKPRDVRSPLFRILGLGGLLFAFGSLLLPQKPPALVIFSQAFQSCILPAVVIPIALLINSKTIMGHRKAGLWMNLGLGAVFLFSLLTSYLAIAELASW